MKKLLINNLMIFSFIITVVVYLIGKYYGFNTWILDQLNSLRLTLYATLAQIMGALAGIVIAGLAILLTVEKSYYMKILQKSKFYGEIFETFVNAIRRLLLGTGICIIALILDKDNNSNVFLTYLVFWAVFISTTSLLKCVWVLKNVIKLQIK